LRREDARKNILAAHQSLRVPAQSTKLNISNTPRMGERTDLAQSLRQGLWLYRFSHLQIGHRRMRVRWLAF
jgi:hypothetical protein